MVEEKHKPTDSEYRETEEAMLREMVDNGFLSYDDFVRFGPPNVSRIFLKEEITSSTRTYNYPEDVEENPELIRSLYEKYLNNN